MSQEPPAKGISRQLPTDEPLRTIELAALLLEAGLTAQVLDLLHGQVYVAIRRCAFHTERDKEVFIGAISQALNAAPDEQALLDAATFVWVYAGRDACNLMANKLIALVLLQSHNRPVSKLALADLILQVDEAMEVSSPNDGLLTLMHHAGLHV